MRRFDNMLSLFLRNVFFTLLQPGLVAGFIPYWILGDRWSSVFKQPFNFHHYTGMILFVIGMVITLACIVSFAIKGCGTLSPLDPTKQLVITGLYRYSRNPMYMGVMILLIGEAIFFQSSSLVTYLLGFFLAFNIFIFIHEEPRLRKEFGQEYSNYCKKVRRWF
ncbi:MAG TPA: isoprenylcysteine carboxylmethyltransferase family protein [Ferruginibacter sp.]|nr:isoprenylcysteine carboxylmethyltransferase family protein [Ferruginibacter sp.]